MTTATREPVRAAPEPGLEAPPDGQEPESGSASLAEFLDRYQDAITSQLSSHYLPSYRPEEYAGLTFAKMLRQPAGSQGEAVRAAVHSLKTNRGTTVVGEMGCGKTLISIAAARYAGYRRVLALCPPHLVEKWRREVQLTFPPSEAQAVIVDSITKLQAVTRQWRDDPGKKDVTLFAILSRETAKLTYAWRNTAIWTKGDPRKTGGSTPRCPGCHGEITDSEDVPYTPETYSEVPTKLQCKNCGQALWEARRQTGHTKPKMDLARYIKKKVRGFFDLLIADEVHEYKQKNSGQGIAAGILAQHCGQSLALTGTMMGGYSSTLFHLLYRFHPEMREEFLYESDNEWVARYGFRQITRRNKNTPRRDGTGSLRYEGHRPPKELPGIMPDALYHIIGHTLFIRLDEVAANLPPYSETVLSIPASSAEDSTGWSQRTAYLHLQEKLKQALMAKKWNGSLAATYLQTLLGYPDACTKPLSIRDPEDGRAIVEMPPLDDIAYPKEQQLAALVKSEAQEGRRCLIYAHYTGEKDITSRLRSVLQQEGLNTVIMRAGSVAPKKRERWIANAVKRKTDALICNPNLVRTGLDLVQFPTIIWFQPDYSVYTMRQASRRSWRPGQTQPVRVFYMTYDDCLQQDALKLVARKTATSLTVEGELPEEGLSSYGDNPDTIFMQLAKQLAGQAEAPQESLDELFGGLDATAPHSQEDPRRNQADNGPGPGSRRSREPRPPETAPPADRLTGRGQIRLF